MFDPSKLIAPQSAYSVTQEEVEAERVRKAKEEFEEEVRSFRTYVFSEPRPNLNLADSIKDLKAVVAYQNQVIDHLIERCVRTMRGIALQAKHVNSNAVNAAGMAQKAWDASQVMVEVHGTRQMALHSFLNEVYFILESMTGVLRRQVPGAPEGEEIESLLEKMNAAAAAAADTFQVNSDFEEAQKRLIEAAKELAKESGRKIVTGGEGAMHMTAGIVRQHGEGMAQRAQANSESFTSRLIKARR